MRNLPVLRRELEVVKKLEIYYRERAALLAEQEETQKKIRDYYRYQRLPKLPTEIIVQILSGFYSENYLNTEIPNAISVLAKGLLLPHLILKPYLALPSDTKLVLTDIDKQKMEISVLKNPDVLRSISLEVDIKDWEIVRDEEGILHVLMQDLSRWKKLQLFFRETKSVLPMIKTFGPCFQYIEELTTYGYESIIEMQSFPPYSVEPIATGPLETIKIQFCVLPALSNLGLLKQVKNLYLFGAGIRTFKAQNRNSFRTAMNQLPRILSDLTSLEFLRLINSYCDEDNDLPKVRSSTRRTLELAREGGGFIARTFLALFSECPIETLDVDSNYGHPMMAELVEIFPGVKKMTYVSSSSYPDSFWY